MTLPEADYNEWAGFFSFKPTEVLKWLLNSPCKITFLCTGNQFGKTDTAAMDMILSVMGMHPNDHKNIKPEDTVRTIRFGSQTLPGEKEGDEVRNTQYPALMRRLPRTFIEKDITARRPVVSVKTPTGKNANIEFVSYSQEVQSTAGTQRKRFWGDEESSRDFFEEQVPRLLAADGDILITATPVPGSIGWQYDLFYTRAKYIYRTKAVRDRIYERTGEILPECEVTKSKDDICVIMAATDDNPIYEDLAKKRSEQTGKPVTAKEYVDTLFEMYDDEDVIDARRYGIFSQLSSKVYKSFTPAIHVVSHQECFPEGVPSEWKHFRGIDYHTNTPWACVWMSVSPENEAFIWCDYSANPARMITYDIALNVAQRSGDYRYTLDLIDPSANTFQVNTNLTTVDDLNRYFMEFKKQGIGTGGHWRGWDTKGGRGREEFIKRMLNSIKVGKPFNNKVVSGKDVMQRAEYLPTVWITENCRNVIESVKNWRFDEWKSRESFAKHEMKGTTQKRWSHFPDAIECLFKNPMVTAARWGAPSGTPLKPKRYFSR